ncbi:LPS-assembly protein LptD [Yoonia sediminilitoris]|uniref:LPS-assembly protein LptD n=1 Tax=Yoonia sediminilitoris TaxID=1286148 RepID=A0A2T6KCT2_9RHOB|nr:LPS assembly protein LptD [Yoonia sediminilitoris]PUB12756.1 LPS-assembly protein [Yoonia sediminilitoris]RCW94235.1 LPS-assembly protein [Yoonia sediminilitoris]
MRWLLFLFCMWPCFAVAQGAATLVADSVVLTEDKQLVASGNVEVLYEGTKLTATAITYDQPSDRLVIDGPIVIKAADGTLLVADKADLDPRLQNGMLLGARLVLDQQLQLAANQIDRREGRFSQLYRTAATSCQVCGEGPPLWDIRAERVVHDAEEKQLYFDNAIVRIKGLPVFWLPRMRLPDPTLDRANGFLIPSQETNTQLGVGIRLPYFVTLGDSRDVTLTPYLSEKTRTLELIYRQAFTNGNLRLQGAASRDTLEEGLRTYLFANGNFNLPQDVALRFDIETVSDPSYLSDYNYSSKDRIDSAVSIIRVKQNSLLQANLTYYQTLRDDETNSTLPPIVAELGYEQRLRPAIGGITHVEAGLDLSYRFSDLDGVRGRDVVRAGVASGWENSWVLPGGILASAQTGARLDAYWVADDAAFSDERLRVVPNAAVALRWPWAMTTATGVTHVIEPVVQAAASTALGGTPPNEDSTRNEFDSGNLLALSRFAGDDAVETGTQAAYGVSWTRYGNEGASSRLAFGRVVRDSSETDFTPSSGLSGSFSDWLIAGQIRTPDGFSFDAYALLDDTGEATRAASLIGWESRDLSLATAYIWQAADPIEEREETLSEWTVDAGAKITQAWSLTADGRYNVAQDRPVSAALGLRWRNECVTIDVSASRRYSSSTNVEPTTTYGISGSLTGFSVGRSQSGPAAPCRN